MADERPDGFETKPERRGAEDFEEVELTEHAFKLPGRRLLAGLVCLYAGLVCLFYVAVIAILGDGFDWMPWLPLAGGLILVGAVRSRVLGRSEPIVIDQEIVIDDEEIADVAGEIDAAIALLARNGYTVTPPPDYMVVWPAADNIVVIDEAMVIDNAIELLVLNGFTVTPPQD